MSEQQSVTPEMRVKASKDLKDHTEFFVTPEHTYIIIAAVHKEPIRNAISRISCKKGVPLGGYIYDSQSDTYHVECCDYFHLGYVPISFAATVAGTGWKIRIPLCESVIKKFSTDLQKKELKNFRNHFKNEDYRIEFIQMIDPN